MTDIITINMSSKKRKTEASDDPICIVHILSAKCDKFTLLTDCDDPQERLDKLKDICRMRLPEPATSSYRMADVCAQVPDQYSPDKMYGYHRDCYQAFTKNLNRLNIDKGPNTSCGSKRPTRRSSTECDKFVFQPSCIFCDKDNRKKVKKGSAWTTEGLCKFKFGGGETILTMAEK